MGPFLLTRSNPIRKNLVLNRTRKLCATIMLTFNRGKTGIVKSSEINNHNLKETASTVLQ